MPGEREWQGMTRVIFEEGRLRRYSIIFLRKHEDG